MNYIYFLIYFAHKYMFIDLHNIHTTFQDNLVFVHENNILLN